MRTAQLAILAAVWTLLLTDSALAQSAVCGNPCGKGYAYTCDDSSCRCVPKTGSNWFVRTSTGTASGSFTSADRNAAFECVPELNQCGCNGVVDCFNMFLSLEVKCESFVCNDQGCICHFPNNIPN